MITIAHRLNTIINSDRVLVLQFGQVIEYENPQKLLNDKNSQFYQLVQDMQKSETN